MGSILRITWLAWSSHKWAAFGMIGVMVLWGISPIFELNALIQFTNLLSTFQIRDNFQPLVNHLFLFILWSLLIPNLCWQVYYFLFDIVRQYAQKKIAFDSLDKATKLPLKALEDSKVQDLIFRTSRIDTGDVFGDLSHPNFFDLGCSSNFIHIRCLVRFESFYICYGIFRGTAYICG